jgi:type I restriction enzyme, S subunit
MKSSYKKLGQYIQEIDERNTADKKENLQGVSTRKVFIESVANTVGTNFKRYKLVKKHQFVYVPDTGRRGDRIGIALLEHLDNAMVSQAYTVFKVKDINQLLPEYLMMWFRRPEFDRYARFKSHGSVREIFSWEEMCNVELPVPAIEKQRKIVAEYNTIVDRIELNKQLIQKLEESAQANYRHWFVDFEFPDENGQPYKSSGGTMEWNEELAADIPKDWQVLSLDDVKELIIDNRGKTPKKISHKINDDDFPVLSAKNVKMGKIIYPQGIRYLAEGYEHPWKSVTLLQGDIAITTEAPMGELYYFGENTKYILSQRLIGIRADKSICSGIHLYFWLQSSIAKRELEERSTGTTVSGIKQSELLQVKILVPKKEALTLFEKKALKIMHSIEKRYDEIMVLEKIKEQLLVKISRI